MKAKYRHRLPKHWTSEFGQWGVTAGGATIDHQAIIDAELLDYANTGCFWWFDKYPEAADIAPDTIETSQIQIPFHAYLASPNKSLVKFACIVFPSVFATPGAFEHAAAQYAALAALIADPQYQRVQGKPVVGFYGVMDSTSWPAAQHAALLAAIGEPIFGVSVTHSNSTVNTYLLQGETAYGPNPSIPAGTSRVSYATQLATDKTFWGAIPGTVTTICFNPTNNGSPISGPRAFADWPTLPEWIRALRQGFDFNQIGVGNSVMGSIYSHSEIAEGGGLNMAQFVSPTTGQSYILDGLRYATLRAAPPASYQYELSASAVGGAIAHTGTGWTTHGPTQGNTADGTQIDGAHDSDEERSSTTNDTIVFTHEALLAVNLRATTGPDRGQCSVTIDAGAPVTVDLYASSQTVHALVWSSGALSNATHSVTVTVLGTKNSSSSSVLVGVDSFGPTFDVRMI